MRPWTLQSLRQFRYNNSESPVQTVLRSIGKEFDNPTGCTNARSASIHGISFPEISRRLATSLTRGESADVTFVATFFVDQCYLSAAWTEVSGHLPLDRQRGSRPVTRSVSVAMSHGSRSGLEWAYNQGTVVTNRHWNLSPVGFGAGQMLPEDLGYRVSQ